MPKHFDTALAEALDVVAGSNAPRGAAAARTRGRKRTKRWRITAAVMACALVAGGTAAGFKAVSLHDARTAAAGSNSADGPHDPSQIIPGAMLTPADLSVVEPASWKLVKTSASFVDWQRPISQQYAVGDDGPCFSLGSGIVGLQEGSFETSHEPVLAVQDYFIYPTAAAAADSYAKGVEGLNACSQHPGAHATVRETDVVADGSAWSRAWTSTSPDSPFSDHFYVLCQGRVVEWAGFSLIGDTGVGTSHDSDFLSTLEAKLAILTHS